MTMWRLLFPLTIPLGVLVVGLWRLAVEQPSVLAPTVASSAPQLMSGSRLPRPDYSVAPSATTPTCTANPNLADALLLQAQRIGVSIRASSPELPGKDATYRAEPGRLGTINLRQRPMSAEVRCMLISHELIHVLQHLHGQLKGVPPLGWPTTGELLQRFGSPQEAEAYGHQNQAGHVLMLLQATPAP